MALIKEKQINRDISANFWNVEGFNYDNPSKALEVKLGLYTSKQSKLDGDTPIKTEHIQINNVEPSDLEDDISSFIETKLKTDPTIFPVLVSEEIPGETEVNHITGEIIVISPRIPAVYKSYFEDAEDDN